VDQGALDVMVACVLQTKRMARSVSYGPQHVRWLRDQVPGDFVCLSSVDISGVDTIPLRHGWPGWWSKIELFSDAIPGDLLYLDLDSVVVGDLQKLKRDQTTVCSDFLRPQHVNSSVMYIRDEDKPRVYESFLRKPDRYMQEYRRWPAKWGDQGFVERCLPNAQRFEKGLVRSYRTECKSGPTEGTIVVTFHGKPKPWDARQEWVPCLN
jgi:hypothetical protein